MKGFGGLLFYVVVVILALCGGANLLQALLWPFAVGLIFILLLCGCKLK